MARRSTIESMLVHSATIAVALLVVPGVAAAQSAVWRARLLYNQAQYDAAIAAATEARRTPTWANAASLVLGRAHLERFRRSADPADLAAARSALRSVNPAALGRRDRLELTIGLAEGLYLDDEYGAAAELLEPVVARAELAGPQALERVLDWWASALDRHAPTRALADRQAVYRRIVDRMREELERDPPPPAASYWLAAGLRGLGDVGRALDAARAGWVRASSSAGADRGAALRADLDVLVLQAIIPDRARQLAASAKEIERAAAALRGEWEELKQKWSR